MHYNMHTKKKHWKKFWEDLGYSVQKIDNIAKYYNKPSYLKKLMKKVKVSEETFNKVVKLFKQVNTKTRKVEFYYFINFFTSNNESITLRYGLDLDKSFLKLAIIFARNNQTKVYEFQLINFRANSILQGKGRQYRVLNLDKKIKRIFKVKKGFFCPRVKGRLSYTEEIRGIFAKELLFVIRRGSKRNGKYKYLYFDATQNRIYFSPTFSHLEIYKLLSRVSELGVEITIKPEKISFDKIIYFIYNGVDENAIGVSLKGVTFADQNLIITLSEDHYLGKPQGSIQHLVKAHWQTPNIFSLRSIIVKVSDFNCTINFRPVNGMIYTNLNSRKLGPTEQMLAEKAIKEAFDIDLGVGYEVDFDKEEFYKKFLDKPSSLKKYWSKIPFPELQTYSELVDKKVLLPKKSDFRLYICMNRCRKQGVFIWSPKNICCSACTQPLLKIGAELIYSKDKKNILAHIKKFAINEGYSAEIAHKHVARKPLDLIKIFDKTGQALAIVPLYSRKDLPKVELFCKRFPNISIVSSGLHVSVTNPIHQIYLGDFFHNYFESISKRQLIKEAFEDQLAKEPSRVAVLAEESAVNLKKLHNLSLTRKNYLPIDFEMDCYNLLHSVFKETCWLGIKYSGKKLPDGIGALPKIPSVAKNSFMWDCKLSFSDKGIGLGTCKKNRAYLDFALQNQAIKNFGRFIMHITISNKLNEQQCLKVITQLAKSRKYKQVKFILLDSRELYSLYQLYTAQESNLLRDNHKRELFYTRLFEYFELNHLKKIDSTNFNQFLTQLKISLSVTGIESIVQN